VNVDTIVIETKIVLLVPTMCVLFVHALTAKMFQIRLQGMNTDSFQPAGEARIIKADDIYECLACGKMYTAEAMYDHEDVCDKIEEYLKSKST
tara:strand:- start:97 stop:375 length:279 start_codon:yes stop_codon:yes gene_type:complete